MSVSPSTRRVLLCLHGAVLYLASGLHAQDVSDLASRAREILERKCGECHGPGAPNAEEAPEANAEWGGLGDLQRFRGADRGKRLRERVLGRRMPPDYAKSGPLSKDELELLRVWIEAGPRRKRSKGLRGREHTSRIPTRFR